MFAQSRIYRLNVTLPDSSSLSPPRLLPQPQRVPPDKCWHLCHSNDAGDNNDEGVKEIAFRLNQEIVGRSPPTEDLFTKGEISKHVDREIAFLRDLCHNRRGIRAYGLAQNFSQAQDYRNILAMGFNNELPAVLVRNAVEIECSEIAQRSFLLYRGANPKRDDVARGSVPYSLSYGSGMFSGCRFDIGACPFAFMRKQEYFSDDRVTDCYVIPVPFGQLHNSPFYIPVTNAVAQLHGRGVVFHPRTKGWKGSIDDCLGGVYTRLSGDTKKLFESELDKQELCRQFREEYQKAAISLCEPRRN